MRTWREIDSLYFLILSLFPPSLSIPYIKMRHILLQNVKYGTFVANVTKNLTYVLWENNSGSNLRRESSASCEGLGYFVTNLWLGRAPRQKKNKFMHFLVPLYRPVRYAHGILCDSEILFSRSDNCSSSLRVHDPRWLIESIQNRIIIPFFHSL